LCSSQKGGGTSKLNKKKKEGEEERTALVQGSAQELYFKRKKSRSLKKSSRAEKRDKRKNTTASNRSEKPRKRTLEKIYMILQKDKWGLSERLTTLYLNRSNFTFLISPPEKKKRSQEKKISRGVKRGAILDLLVNEEQSIRPKETEKGANGEKMNA